MNDSTQYNGKQKVRSYVTQTSGFGTLTQGFNASTYHGKRVRFAAAVKTMDVSGLGGLWMRVDGPERNESLEFDTTKDWPITDMTDWQIYEIVLDVPGEATAICFGIIVGTGPLVL